jgi:CRP-like cAMP-binding protein
MTHRAKGVVQGDFSAAAGGGAVAITAKAVLRENLLLRGLAESTLDRVAELALRRSYPRGTVIFRQGDAGDALYAVISGEVRISSQEPSGREVFLNIMESGDVFGEVAMLDGGPRTATAIATSDTSLFLITRVELLHLLERDPALARHLLQVFCQRLRWASELVEEAAFLDVPARLASRLLRLCNQHGTKAPDGKVLNISQGDLANFLSASRQVVNQNLQGWRERGWIELSRGKVVIRDSEALADLAKNRPARNGDPR